METSKTYGDRIKRHTPKSPYIKNSLLAFIFGGGICLFGELLSMLYSLFIDEKNAYILVTLTVIFLSALITSLGFYDNIVRIAGAGLLVPVSGFANSIVSPALDTRNEGLIAGIGSGIFKVAGPVILFSVLAGSFYGLIYYLSGVVI